MAKYKVLAPFKFRGAQRQTGDIIELSESKLQKLRSAGLESSVEKVKEKKAPIGIAGKPMGDETETRQTPPPMGNTMPPSDQSPSQPSMPGQDVSQNTMPQGQGNNA